MLFRSGIALDRPQADFWLDAHDVEAMIALQDRIEAGQRFVIPSAPRREAAQVLVPIAQVA